MRAGMDSTRMKNEIKGENRKQGEGKVKWWELRRERVSVRRSVGVGKQGSGRWRGIKCRVKMEIMLRTLCIQSVSLRSLSTAFISNTYVPSGTVDAAIHLLYSRRRRRSMKYPLGEPKAWNLLSTTAEIWDSLYQEEREREDHVCCPLNVLNHHYNSHIKGLHNHPESQEPSYYNIITTGLRRTKQGHDLCYSTSRLLLQHTSV